MKIQNINGTSQNNCICGSWLRHWEKFSDQIVPHCPAPGCYRTDLLGAHAQKAYGSDDKWYIYPLCGAHNQSKGVLEVSDSYKLVSANKEETCEK